MDERLRLGLIAVIVLCSALAAYLAIAVQEGPKPPHSLRETSLDGRQFLAARVICGPGARSGEAGQEKADLPIVAEALGR